MGGGGGGGGSRMSRCGAVIVRGMYLLVVMVLSFCVGVVADGGGSDVFDVVGVISVVVRSCCCLCRWRCCNFFSWLQFLMAGRKGERQGGEGGRGGGGRWGEGGGSTL